jgi:hypothetical protein
VISVSTSSHNFFFSKTLVVAEKCEILIKAIDQIYQSEMNELILNKTKEGTMNVSECWREFRHAAGRLESYLLAIRVLISTRSRWPSLFDNFTVNYVASSTPAPNPLGMGNRSKKLSTDSVIGRMTSDHSKMVRYKAHAQELQKFGLDDELRHKAQSKKFRPIVHSEVLLLASLERDGGTHPSRFFNGYKYIGCSKPTCRLCEYYFSAHTSGLEVRPTHRNIYPNWRMPDVYQREVHDVGKQREDLMGRILVRIREDAFRVLSEKVTEKKIHDSNTEPTYPLDSHHGQRYEDLEQFVSNFSDLGIDPPKVRTKDDLGQVFSVDKSNTFTQETDEEDGGGVKI